MQGYAVFLQSNLPLEVNTLLAQYLQTQERDGAAMQFVYCTRFESFSRFLECDVVKPVEKEQNWTVYIPMELVIAIAEVGPDKPGPGFLSKI
jgi:hypothetical protein